MRPTKPILIASKKSWTALPETTINSGTTAIISYMLIELRLRWSSLMVPKTGTSNRFTSLTCSKPFQPTSRNTSSITMVPMSISTTGSLLTSVRVWMPSSLKNCWAMLQAMNCLLSSGRTIQENKVGLPWMILAIKQVSGPSYSEMVKKSSKTATRQKITSAMARLIRPS